MNHVLLNKLDDELCKAINEVGGDTSSATGPWDYPEIIKEQLEAKNVAAELKAGPGIIIRECQGQKFICSTSGALTTGALNPPSGSYKQPVSEVIEAGTPVQEVFEALFYKILPRMSSVYKGDIIKASVDGSDRYNEEDTRSGLIPSATYLRLYVANRQEPVYILMSGHGIVNDEDSMGGEHANYVGGESEYLSVSVNGNTITATLNQKGIEVFDKVMALETSVRSLEQVVSEQTKDVDEIQGDISDINSRILDLNQLVNGKADADELNGYQNTLNAVQSALNVVTSQVNNLSTRLSSMEVSLDSKVDKAEFNTLKVDVNEFAEKTNEAVKSAEEAVQAAENASNQVSGLESQLNAKADITVVDSVRQEIVTVKQDVTKIQQESVTIEQVKEIANDEITHVVNNTDIVSDVSEEVIVSALNSTEDNEIKKAVNNLIEDTIAANSTDDTTDIVDDVFAGV